MPDSLFSHTVQYTIPGPSLGILQDGWHNYIFLSRSDPYKYILKVELKLVISGRVDATQRAQTSKNIQKPPHSTLWIPGLYWPKIQKEWSAEVKLFSKISKKRQNLAKNHWENSVPLKMGRPNLDTIQPKWIGKLHSKGIMPIFRGSYLTEWKCSGFPCLNLTNFSWICKIS